MMVSGAVRRGRALEYFGIAYNVVECAVSLAAGWAAGSVSLVGFGLDSLIEVTSSAAVLWRLSDGARTAHRERAALRIVGCCFLALAAYVAYEAGGALYEHHGPDRTIAGMAITAASVLIMPLLARAKRRAAADLGSAAMHADSRQTDFCAWLSAFVLAGLLLDNFVGWWWADAAAALAMTPVIVREGWSAIHGENCGCGGSCR